MVHAFLVDQTIRLKRRFPDVLRQSKYQIVRLLPSRAEGTPLYLVRSLTEAVEWVISEDGIESAQSSDPNMLSSQ